MRGKSFIPMLLASLLGGVFAILLYVTLVPQPKVIPTSGGQSPVAFTNYVFDSSDFVVPEGLNFVFAAKKATPAVVHIRTAYASGRSASSPFQDFFKEYFGDRYRDYQNPQRGAGSGVIVSEDGFIVTNNHVIEGASEIEVLLNDNRSYEAEVIGTDPSTDIAVIKIKEDDLPTVTFGDSDNIQIGEWVLAIGNPFEFRSTVTAGIVSAKARNINILAGRDRLEAFIQTDAAVNPGNSGGALVNLRGELVGINTAIASPTGAFAGYSFAIPVSLVQKVVADLRQFGIVQRAMLGISIRDVNAELAREQSLDLLQGVYVIEVAPGSAALEAGLKEGDVIVAINGRKVSNVAELQEQVALNRPGDKVKVTYMRNGKSIDNYATLKNSSNTTDIVEVTNSFRSEGAIFEEVGTDVAEKLGIDGGIQVRELETGRWKSAGIRKGFVITRISKMPVKSLEDFVTIINRSTGEGLLIEGYYPDGEKAYYGIGW